MQKGKLMKKLTLALITLTTGILFTGCATGDRFQVDHRTGLWYEASNDNCPNVSYNADKSITCYAEDKKTVIRTIQPVTEDQVREYRAIRDAKRKQERMEIQAYNALRARAFNPNSARIGF